MAEGAWVVLGTAIGTAGSILTTWLTAYLKKKEENDPYDAFAMRLLGQELKHHKWCNIKSLANIIGLDEGVTREYLILLNARGSRKDGKKWGLVEKNPLSEEDTE